jgi:hypothetical protein
MPSLEERVAYLEGRTEEHAAGMRDWRAGIDEVRGATIDLRGEMKGALVDLRDEMKAGFVELRGEIGELRGEMTRRFERVDARFTQVDNRFTQVDHRFVQVDDRFMQMDEKIDRHFTWLVGIQVAGLIAVVGALVGTYYR